MPRTTTPKCSHPSLHFTPSPHAVEVGYQRPNKQQRLAAARRPRAKKRKHALHTDTAESGRGEEEEEEEDPKTFPAPLLLPGDDLSLDPDCPPQSFQEWLEEEEDRNEVTAERNVIYVVPPPEVDRDVDFMRMRERSQRQQGDDDNNNSARTKIPRTQDIVDYLAAFYHGLPVKLLPSSDVRFIPWENNRRRKVSKGAARSKPQPPRPRYIGLSIPSRGECVRIRTRAAPDGLFPRQLNLDDLLDAAISMLPEDAYALLFLVNHDLFEDDDDTFVCGRAYGGSRVAVVSSARYSPDLDGIQSVERQHAWPASHCEKYMSACCKSSQGGTMQKQRKSKDAEESKNGQPVQNAPLAPLEAALSASYTLPDVDSSPPSLLSALWLGRVCRTASHELGHCFGIEHCVYYACIMQGSASLSEDARQPPYLCPVDLAKILCATGMTASQRYLALLAHCERPYNKGTHFFSTYAAWIHSRLKEMGEYPN